jgi:Domain of unknown function (DUF4390)
MRAGALVLVAAVALAGTAQGAEPPVRLTGLHRRGGRLLAVSVGVPDIIRPEDLARLTSGFATRVLFRVSLFRLDRPEPVAVALRFTEIVYDLWDEKFRVRVGGADERLLEKPEEALALATELRTFPVAELALLEPGVSYQLHFQADLNPLSPEVVREVRRWLVRPPGQGRLGPADSFFGSFVSFFFNPKIDDSERRIEFVSQPFVGWPR